MHNQNLLLILLKFMLHFLIRFSYQEAVCYVSFTVFGEKNHTLDDEKESTKIYDKILLSNYSVP